jgi:hypothetical protein
VYATFSRRSASHRNHDHNRGRRARGFEPLESRTMFDATIEPACAGAGAASEPDPNAPGCTIPFLAPVVYQARFDDERAPHTISITFSEDVWASLDPQDLTLIDEHGRYVYDTRVATVNWDADTNTAHWVFVRADGGALPEGKWHATLNADEVFDADGHALDGDGDGTPGGEYAFKFGFLRGDANHDGRVDGWDLDVLAENFGRPGTFSQGDFDYDGRVDLNDFAVLSTRMEFHAPEGAPEATTGFAPSSSIHSRVPNPQWSQKNLIRLDQLA